jgi:hypothetical protein
MQQVSSFGTAGFRWTPLRIRLSSGALWAVPLLVAFGAVLGLAFGPNPRTPVQSAHAAPVAQGAQAPLPYVSSDPSVPPADSVKFPEAQPHIEAF